MLPRAAYVDPAVLAWEHENFFGGWICVGRSVDLAKPGSQKAVARRRRAACCSSGARTGSCAAFVNACRHRGHELLPCGARRPTGSCAPTTRGPTGSTASMRNAPHMEGGRGLRPGPVRLAGLPVAEWHGWVFVASSGQAEPFEEHIGRSSRSSRTTCRRTSRSPRPTSTSSRPTGRSSRRTTRSATTAR